MGTFEAVQAQYEKNKNAGGGGKFQNQEERMKKYSRLFYQKVKRTEKKE